MINNNSLVPGFNDEKDDSLKISLDKIDALKSGLCIYLNGYIDTYNSNFFQKKIQEILQVYNLFYYMDMHITENDFPNIGRTVEILATNFIKGILK